MRKEIVSSLNESIARAGRSNYLDLERLGRVEITSEEATCPIESALAARPGPGWRAAQSGAQIIRVLFDEPQRLRRILLVFDEPDTTRTQEFSLRWSGDGGQTYREVVRQQYNFSPPDTMHELEEYDVDLAGVTVLELRVVPDISGGGARASLAMLRLG
jgi:hypothetical protein